MIDVLVSAPFTLHAQAVAAGAIVITAMSSGCNITRPTLHQPDEFLIDRLRFR